MFHAEVRDEGEKKTERGRRKTEGKIGLRLS